MYLTVIIANLICGLLPFGLFFLKKIIIISLDLLNWMNDSKFKKKRLKLT